MMGRFFTTIIDTLLFFLLRLFGIDCTQAEVSRRRYGIGSKISVPELSTDNAGLLERLLDAAKEEFKTVEDRLHNVESKVRFLLTLVGMILGLLTIFVSKSPSIIPPLLIGVPFLISLILLMAFYGVNNISTVNLDPETAAAESDTALLKKLIRNYSYASELNSHIVAFHLDIFQAARRCVLTGLFLSVLAAFVFARNYTSAGELFASIIKTHPDLVEILKGPPGDPGPRGETGPTGPTGATGPSAPAADVPTAKPASPVKQSVSANPAVKIVKGGNQKQQRQTGGREHNRSSGMFH